MSCIAISRKHNKLLSINILDFALCSYARSSIAVRVDGQGDYVFGDNRGRSLQSVVLDETGVATVGVGGAAVLDCGGLEEGVEVAAVGGHGEAFETGVVVAAGERVFGGYVVFETTGGVSI